LRFPKVIEQLFFFSEFKDKPHKTSTISPKLAKVNIHTKMLDDSFVGIEITANGQY
jgi:hypothetical protein